jgi:hypothetical protein
MGLVRNGVEIFNSAAEESDKRDESLCDCW